LLKVGVTIKRGSIEGKGGGGGGGGGGRRRIMMPLIAPLAPAPPSSFLLLLLSLILTLFIYGRSILALRSMRTDKGSMVVVSLPNPSRNQSTVWMNRRRRKRRRKREEEEEEEEEEKEEEEGGGRERGEVRDRESPLAKKLGIQPNWEYRFPPLLPHLESEFPSVGNSPTQHTGGGVLNTGEPLIGDR